jgi:signal transduction histidine kinase
MARHPGDLWPFWGAVRWAREDGKLPILRFHRLDAALGTLPPMSPSADASQRRDALVQAGLVLASELSLPSILQKIVELACQVADARYGALGVLDSDGRMIFDFITHGVTEEERRAIGNLPVGKGILGLLITEARPIRLTRIQDHPRSVGFPPNHPPMTSFLGVPMKVRGRIYGNLYLTEKRGAAEFTEQDQEAVVTLAAQAGVAIENARLQEDLRRLAVLEDRERIAQELHDGVIQSLFAVGMGLQAAGAMTDDPETVRGRLDAAVNDVDRVIRDLRNYIFGLGGGPADRELSRALHGLADELRRGSDIAIRVDVDPAAPGALASRATDIAQFAREALTNAVRHSGAATVSVVISREDGSFVVEIEDDGKGFDPEATEGPGRGLGNLRARAQSLGADLDIDSEPGRGTKVRLVMPA